MTDLTRYSLKALMKLVKAEGSKAAAAKKIGVATTTFKDQISRLETEATQPAPKKVKPMVMPKPKKGVVKSYIFTSAQNDTEVDTKFFENLKTYAAMIGASIGISGFTYNKSLFQEGEKTDSAYAPELADYMVDHPIQISDRLIFCGEMDILPTATDPLSGFETYTRSMWGVFPHPRVSMKSIATLMTDRPKLLMTTGCITKPNYITKKAGLKARFHHVIGALLVEIDGDGDVFCRHLIAEKNGAFQDLTVRVDGEITYFNRVEAITWGDIHTEQLDVDVALGSWGITVNMEEIEQSHLAFVPLVDSLRPKHQFFHDVIDFRRRNHHNIGDEHFNYRMWWEGCESIADELIKVGAFLHATKREFSKSYVIDSNHDRALLRWLRTANYRADPVNALFFLQCQTELYQSIMRGEDILIAEWATNHVMEEVGQPIEDVRWIKRTESFRICTHAGGGIECALHGDQGANGAKGNINSFAKMGPKANTADKHAAAIFEGIYQAGHSCSRDMHYNRGGLSSWSPSHVVTYPSGKRVIITMQGHKYCAGMSI